VVEARREIRALAFVVRGRRCNGTLVPNTRFEEKENTMMLKRVTVKKNERGLLLRNGDFVRILRPGTHWLFAGLDTLQVDLFAIEQPAFTHHLADYMMA